MSEIAWAPLPNWLVRGRVDARRAVVARARQPAVQERNAALLIDVAGRIADCNPAATKLLGREGEGLSGRAVAAVIPELPFALNTPGYNLAYAVFHAADGLWMQQTALRGDGRQIPVDISLSSVTRDGSPCIALRLRPSASRDQKTSDATWSSK